MNNSKPELDVDLAVEQMLTGIAQSNETKKKETKKKETSTEHMRSIKKRADDWHFQKELEQIDRELNFNVKNI